MEQESALSRFLSSRWVNHNLLIFKSRFVDMPLLKKREIHLINAEKISSRRFKWSTMFDEKDKRRKELELEEIINDILWQVSRILD